MRAFEAGADQILHSPDPIAAFNGMKAALASGRIAQAQIDDVGRARAAREGVGRPAHAARARSRRGARRMVGGRAHEAIAQEAFARVDHAGQGRSPPGAADRAARRADAVSVGARLPVRLADRGAEPHVHPGAEEAVAERHRDRSVRSHADVGTGSGARRGAALRRGRRVGVRALDVGQRASGPRTRAGAAAARFVAA